MKKCSWCGKEETSKNKVIEGPDTNICNKCFETMREEFEEKLDERIENFDVSDLMKPHEIKAKLDEFIIGQEEAKKLLSVSVYNHYKRISIKTKTEIQKTNIMLLGPTGSGKTYIMQILAKILNVPLLIIDATSFTEAGYVGDNVEDILKKLYLKAGKNMSLAEKGIVYIDEVDKLLSKSDNANSRDINGTGVQQGLLKILEDCEVSFKIKQNEIESKEYTMNTKNILFVAGGAFVGIEKIIEQRLRKSSSSIGFTSSGDEDVDNTNSVISDDIIKYGMIPEFVGRIPVFVQINKLSAEELSKILTKPKNCITKQYKSLFKVDGINLKFDKDSIAYIVEQAEKKKLGARGLRGVLDKQMNTLMYEIPKYKLNKLTITKDLLTSNSEQIEKYLKDKEKED